MTETATESVLVVIADPELRQLVGWLLGELDLSYVLAARWRAGVAAVTGRPSLLLCDIDDLHENPLDLAALAARGWDVPVPLIISSRRPDVEAFAGAFGAVEGLRKPINTGRLISMVSRYVATASPFDGA
jgi:CheY-like chemotaxis protein